MHSLPEQIWLTQSVSHAWCLDHDPGRHYRTSSSNQSRQRRAPDMVRLGGKASSTERSEQGSQGD